MAQVTATRGNESLIWTSSSSCSQEDLLDNSDSVIGECKIW